MSRLTIDISEEQHKSLKAVAAFQGKTIKQYALERLFPDADGQNDDEAWEEFKTFINKRIDEALAEPASWSTFDEAWPEEGSMDKAA
jgi:uncharacterized protein (DUF1778 family)